MSFTKLLPCRLPGSEAPGDSDVVGFLLDSKISSGRLNSVSSFGKGRLSSSSWENV